MDLVRRCSDLVRTLFGPRSEVFGPRSEVFKCCSEVLGSVQPADRWRVTATSSSSGLADKKSDSVIFPAFRFNRMTEKLTINVPKHVGASIIWDYRCPH